MAPYVGRPELMSPVFVRLQLPGCYHVYPWTPKMFVAAGSGLDVLRYSLCALSESLPGDVDFRARPVDAKRDSPHSHACSPSYRYPDPSSAAASVAFA